jgi:hypothetical protein
MEEGGVRRYNGEMDYDDYDDEDGAGHHELDHPGAAPGHNTAMRSNNNNNNNNGNGRVTRMGSFPCIPEEGGDDVMVDHQKGRQQNKDGVWDKFWGSL